VDLRVDFLLDDLRRVVFFAAKVGTSISSQTRSQRSVMPLDRQRVRAYHGDI
jgi:hypothetical protein